MGDAMQHQSIYAMSAADARADELERRCQSLVDALADTAIELHQARQDVERWRAFGKKLFREMADRGKRLESSYERLAETRLGPGARVDA